MSQSLSGRSELPSIGACCPRRTNCSHHLQAFRNWAAHALIRNPIPIKAASSDTIRSGMRSCRDPCDDEKMQNTERKKYPNAIACFCIMLRSIAEPTAWYDDCLSGIEQPAVIARLTDVIGDQSLNFSALWNECMEMNLTSAESKPPLGEVDECTSGAKGGQTEFVTGR